MVGLDATIIMNPKVWIASGHVGGFSDPMIDDAANAKSSSDPTTSGTAWETPIGAKSPSRKCSSLGSTNESVGFVQQKLFSNGQNPKASEARTKEWPSCEIQK